MSNTFSEVELTPSCQNLPSVKSQEITGTRFSGGVSVGIKGQSQRWIRVLAGKGQM